VEKFINSIIQMIAYFLIVYIIFFIAQKIGVWTKLLKNQANFV